MFAAIGHATKVEAAEKDPKVAQDAINAVWARGHGLSGKMVARNQLNRFSRADAISKASHHEEESRGDQQRCDSRTAGGSFAFPSLPQVTLKVPHQKRATFRDEEAAKTGRSQIGLLGLEPRTNGL